MTDLPKNAPRWQTYGERELYDDNEWLRVTQVDVEPPNGRRFWHHVVHLRPVAVAVVLDDRDRVLMLWRHRFVPDAFAWELPGGIIEKGEAGALAAAREVEEETGWRPRGDPEHLCTFEPMPGMVHARHEVYLYRRAEQVGKPTDIEEAGQIAWVPLAEIPSMILAGRVTAAGSLVGLLIVSRGL